MHSSSPLFLFAPWVSCVLGGGCTQVYTAETVADQFGVVKSSYDAVPLPPIRAYQVQCNDLGKPKDVLELGSEPIPAELEWDEVSTPPRRSPSTTRVMRC